MLLRWTYFQPVATKQVVNLLNRHWYEIFWKALCLRNCHDVTCKEAELSAATRVCSSSTSNEKTITSKGTLKKKKLHQSQWVWMSAGTKNQDLHIRSSFPWYYLPGQICATVLNLLTKASETPEYRLVWVGSVKMLLLRGIYLNLSPFKSPIPAIPFLSCSVEHHLQQRRVAMSSWYVIAH